MINFLKASALKIAGVSSALAQTGGTGGTGGTGFTGGTGGGGVTLTNPLAVTNFTDLIQKILGGLFTLSIPIVSIMVIVGGYQILTAAGNEERFATGRRTVTYAAIGFFVILIANGIVSLIRELVGI